jgi:hypothetical protein
MSLQDSPRIKVGLFGARPVPDQIPIGMIYISTDMPIISVVIGPGTPHTWDDFVAGGLVAGTPNTLAMFTTPTSVGDSAVTQRALGLIVHIGAGLSTRRTDVAGNYIVKLDDHVVRQTDTTAPSLITLPAPALAGDGWECVVKDFSNLPLGGAAANPITVATAGLIDGAPTALVNTDLGALSFQCDGVGYAVIARY